jgi:hypothetical protein
MKSAVTGRTASQPEKSRSACGCLLHNASPALGALRARRPLAELSERQKMGVSPPRPGSRQGLPAGGSGLQRSWRGREILHGINVNNNKLSKLKPGRLRGRVLCAV